MNKLFSHFIVPFIKIAKYREVIVKGVKENKLTLEIDGEHVSVEKKGSGLIFKCSCKGCGASNVANGAICGRDIAAIKYLLEHERGVSEIEVKK
jgi:hypothetical protein